MGTVTINSVAFNIYGDATSAANYHQGSLPNASSTVAWLAASATQQAQALVAATRVLEALTWQGLPVLPVDDSVGGPATGKQALQWPRSGVNDKYGNAVSSSTIPNDIITAAYELAAMLLDDDSNQDNPLSGSNVRSVGAGPAKVEFFRPTLGITGRFPTRIAFLIDQYLAASQASALSVSAASGADGSHTSQFDNPIDSTTGGPGDATYDLTRSV